MIVCCFFSILLGENIDVTMRGDSRELASKSASDRRARRTWPDNLHVRRETQTPNVTYSTQVFTKASERKVFLRRWYSFFFIAQFASLASPNHG